MLVTTTPSGPPISSSCGSAPRWVWNSLPALSVMVCIRPLGSVSCTWSPFAEQATTVLGAGSHEREASRRQRFDAAVSARAEASGAREGPVDVTGGQHAEDATLRVHHEVLGGRQVAHPSSSPGAVEVRGEEQARARAVGRRVPTDTQGRRSTGVAVTAASLTRASGRSSRSTTTSAWAPPSVSRRIASAEGRVGQHRDGPAGQAAHRQLPQLGLDALRAQRLAGTVPDEQRRSARSRR